MTIAIVTLGIDYHSSHLLSRGYQKIVLQQTLGYGILGAKKGGVPPGRGGTAVKRIGKRAAALALCALVMMSAVSPAQGASVYFMAVNDQLLELSDATMPAMVDGILYVPYTMLSANATGVNLGVYATYSAAAGRVLVFSSRRQLVFDLQSNMTYDMNGSFYAERAILRNSTVYLPIARVCDVFRGDIYYTVSRVEYGYLVRVRNSAAELGDEAFIDAAANMMRNYLDRYEQSQPDDEPEPSASEPTPSPTPQVSGDEAWIYLGFTLSEEGTADQVLSALSVRGGQAVFFLTLDQLIGEDDLVRRLLGSGHQVGVRLTAESVSGALEELAAAGEVMAAVAHCRLGLALAEGLNGAETDELEQAGYVCWQTTVDGRGLTGSGASRASALIGQLDRDEGARNYLLLDEGAGETLSTVLSVLEQSDLRVRTPLASAL